MKKGQKTLFPISTLKKETPKLSDKNVIMDTPMGMEIEEKKEDIDIDQVLEESSLNGKKRKVTNLDDSKKEDKKKSEKKTYDIDDTVLRDITLAGDIHVRLISNINGYFVDIRKYFKGFPSKKGIRMLAVKFSMAAEYLKNDLLELTQPGSNK